MTLGEFTCPTCAGQVTQLLPSWLLSSAVTAEEVVIKQAREIERLRERTHSAVDEVQRRYAQMQKEYDRLKHLMHEAYERHKAEMRAKGVATWTEISSYGLAAAASILAERDEARATVESLQEQLEITRGDCKTILSHGERWRSERDEARATAAVTVEEAVTKQALEIERLKGELKAAELESEATRRALVEAKGETRARVKAAVDHTENQYRDIASERDQARDAWKHLDEQIKALADVIMFEVPGEPSTPDGVIPVAIRLIRQAQAKIVAMEKLSWVRNVSDPHGGDIREIIYDGVRNIWTAHYNLEQSGGSHKDCHWCRLHRPEDVAQ